MIIDFCLERRRVEEDDDGDGEENDDVERVHHQPGYQQPPRPFLQSTELIKTLLAVRHIDYYILLTTRRLTSIEYSKQESIRVSTGAIVQGDIPYMSSRM